MNEFIFGDRWERKNGTQPSGVSLTPRFSGVAPRLRPSEPFQRFWLLNTRVRETVETVLSHIRQWFTPLKRGVNEIRRAIANGSFCTNLLACWLLLVGLVTPAAAQITNAGHALSLNGTTAGAAITPNFFNFPSTDITVEFWARSSDLTKAGSLFSYATANNANAFLIYNHQNLTLWMNNASSISSGISIANGAWHHIAVTWSTSGALAIYTNGTLGFSATDYQTGTVIGTGGTLVLGQDQDSLGGGFADNQAFLGDLDEMRVWSMVRTPAQIAQNFTNQFKGATNLAVNTSEPGLVAYCRFNEGIGGIARDATRQRELTLGSGASWSPLLPYNPGTALNFVNGFVEIPHSPAFNAFPMSFTFWMRTTNQEAFIVDRGYSQFSGYSAGGLRIGAEFGVPTASYYRATGNAVFDTFAGQQIDDNLWHHIAFTVDDYGGRLYVDGFLQGDREWSGPPGPPTAVAPLRLGSGSFFGFKGQLDQVAYWNVALDPIALQQIMSRQLAGLEPGLVALYTFDEGTGTLALDRSAGGHDGTLLNDIRWVTSGARISGPRQIGGRVTSGSSGMSNTLVRAFLPPIAAPPLLPIPDNSTVTSTNVVTVAENIGSLKVHVNITHPYRGDLQLTLIHPDGTEVRLKDEDGTDSEPDLVTSYPDPTSPVQSLAVLTGKPIAGNWRLRVVDSFQLDSGVLNSWSLQFGPAPTLTDANGYYVFSNLLVATYMVEPVRDGFTFNPPSSVSPVDRTNVNFAVLSGFVRGRVLDDGFGLGGVTISAGPGATTVTANDGSYQLSSLAPGTHTIAASQTGYTFEPAQRPGVPLGTTNVDFDVTGYPVSGRILDLYSNGVAGVTVSASSGGTPGISGSDGAYLISGVPFSSATITPFKLGVTFSPPSKQEPIGPARSNIDFVASASPPTVTTISDRVIARNSSTGPLRFDVNDAETPAARLRVRGSSSNTNLVPEANIVFGGVGVQRTVTVTPITNGFGTALITVEVIDEAEFSTPQTFNLRVNQPPLAGVGFALNFDGIDDVASASGTNTFSDKGNYSVEAWVYAPSNAGPRTALAQGAQMTIGINGSGQIQAGANWNTGVPWPFGGWHHVALVRDSNDTRLYIDGVLRTNRGSALTLPSLASPFQVGALSTGQYWLGAIDEVRLWRVARTSSEIASNLLVRVTGNEATLNALWRFDEIFTDANTVPTGSSLAINGATRIQSPIVFDRYVTFHGRNINDFLTGYDPDGDLFTFALVTPSSLGGVTLFSTNTGAFLYEADALGDDQFTFSVSDGYATSEAFPIRIQVLPDTNAPVISFLADKTIAEDTVLGPLPFTVMDSEREVHLLPMFGLSSDPMLLPPDNIAFQGTGTNRTFTLWPATNQFGTVTVTFRTTDDTQEATRSFTLTVTPVNDPPVIQPMTNHVTIARGQEARLPIVASDVDTPVGNLFYVVQSFPVAPAYADNCVGAGPCLVIIGSGSQSGNGNIVVNVSDGALTNSQTIQVTVNNPPTIAAIPPQSTFRNFQSKPIPITLADVDDPVGDAVLTASSSNPAVVDGGFTFVGMGANRTLLITPVGGRIGQTTITVTARDTYGSSTRSFQFFVEEGLDFEFVELPHMPGAVASVPNDLNSSLQVVGISRLPTIFTVLGHRAVIWEGNLASPTVTRLTFPAPYSDGKSHVTAINSRGQMVGARLATTDSQAFLHFNGTFTDLAPFGHAFSHAGDIGEGGQIVGINSETQFPPEASFFMAGGVLTNFGGTVYGGRGELDAFGYGKAQVNTENAAVTANAAGHVILRRPDNTVQDLGTFGGTAAIPTGLNDAGQIYGRTVPETNLFIYNYRTQTTTNLQAALAAAGLQPPYSSYKINIWGEAVGSAQVAGVSNAFAYIDGRVYNLQDLRPGSDFRLLQARAINDNGDIAGFGLRLGEPGDSYRAFILKRKHWIVGRPVKPPQQALAQNGRVYRPPSFVALDGTTAAVVAQTTLWSDLEQRYYFLRPVRGRLTWYTTDDLQNTNAPLVERVGTAEWPVPPQLHIAGAPVDATPVDPASPYRPLSIAYSEATGATLDASTWTFNAPNSGYTVIRYLLAPGVPLGGTPNPLTQSNYFEVVRTVLWNDPEFVVAAQPATVGTKVVDPRGPAVAANSFKSGWTVFPLAPFDGAGTDRAYDRATQTGPIIPVNRDTAATTDDLVVAFYKKNTLTGVLWPDLAVPYAISWPTNAQKLTIADSAGSGLLPEAQYADKRIYFQSSTNLPGYNPNEEHAFLAPTSSGEGVFALRNDLNRLNTSSNFVLLKYRNPVNNEWHFKVFQPALTDPTHVFDFQGEVGQEILPPYPLSLFTLCSGTTNISGQAFRDHQGKYYASMGPTAADLHPRVVMRYFYPLQPGFHYDLDGNGTNDFPIGTCVPWNGSPPGTSVSLPIHVTNRIRWPDEAPTLQIGETLLEPKRGLPAVKDWASAQVVFDSLNPNGNMPLTNTARLYDPLTPRLLPLSNIVSAAYQFPPEISLQTIAGKQIFADLPYHLRSRLSYDPVNKTLGFAGVLNENVLGEPLLMLNVLSEKERERIKRLSGEADFRRIIDALYHLTRNPNRVNVANPGKAPPDQALLIGFTTKYTARVTNGVPPNTTITIEEFFGTAPPTNNLAFLATNIVQEPLGDGPKALTAGLPVPPLQASFGSALTFDGSSFVEVGNLAPDAIENTLTFEAWVNPGRGGCQTILSRGNGASAETDYIFQIGWDGVSCGALRIGFWAAGAWDISAGTIPTNQWTHIAVTFNGTEKRFYTNGVLNRVAPRTGNIFQSGSPLYIGRQGLNCNCNFMFGQLDDVRVWKTARTSGQIQDSMRRPLTGTEANLVSYWRFDESSGGNALDSADELHHGVLSGNLTRVASTVPATAGERYVVLAENNDPALGALPVTLHVIRVFGGPFAGDLKTIFPDNVFDQRLTLRHSSDFGADPDRLEFEWWYHPDNADFEPTELPTLNADGSIANAKGWLLYTPALNPNKLGQNTITIGDGSETSQFTLADNWFISRYRGYNIGGQTNWSDWVGDPASAETPRAALAPGWVKRVLDGINPFEARTTNFHDTSASTYASMLIQAGERYEGDIALNPNPANLLGIGLIEAYTTLLNRGRSLSIDGLPPVDSDPLNNALLLAANRISDLYMLFGNEAFADAQDPTIGFFSDSLEFGTLATATFAFKNQLDSLLEEELTLLRGRDDSAAGVGAPPVYNRLLWNFTGSDGEVAYERTYNIGDVNLDSVINENDAKVLFPQGHGDAWGHYLTAIKTYYELLRHPRYTWIPRSESVLVAGVAVKVDFLDERKFANAAAARAKVGVELVDLTYRSKFVDDPEGQYQGYKDTRADRAWGLTEWARRANQGAYFDWLVGNAILPSSDPNTNHVSIQKIDRQTVRELEQIISEHRRIQALLDGSDAGLNPLGLAKGALPFDIDPFLLMPTAGVQPVTHFDQIYDRAERAMNNCVTVWNLANQLSETLRRQQDDVDDFTANVADQERDFKSRLVELFGYPYSGDIGPGKTYPTGYDGPDLYHHMYVHATELTGAASAPTNIINGFFAPFTDGTNAPNYYFSDDLSSGNFNPGPILNVQFPLARGTWAFTAPASFGTRRAPGELQLALSDLLQEETRLKIALGNYDAHVKNIKDAAILLNSRSVLSNRTISILTSNRTALVGMNQTIVSLQDAQLGLRRAASIVDDVRDAVITAIPDSVVDAIEGTLAPVKGTIFGVAVAISQVLQTSADVVEGQQNRQEIAKEETQLQTDINLEIASQEYEVQQQAADLLAMMRDEATLRLEAFNQVELVKQTLGRYLALLHEGNRLWEERTVFRQRTAALTQQNRYKDMAFRIFRNEALQKYRAQFDLTSRYVYLAAAAYDYELNFLGTDNRSGRDFFTDIIRQRSIGQLIDGVPIAGSSGLADPLGRLRQNFEVLKSRFGLNNPQLETARFSLRKELFRIRDDSEDQWRAMLQQAIIADLWDLPEFRRFCRPFAPETAGSQPGLVIRFPTTIQFGLNFFGFPLGGGDNAYDPSLFSTKINSAGVWFTGYDGAGLANAPRVYLIPAGMDVQRSPTGNTLATREWKIIDQVIPVPFPIGVSALSDPTWIPLNDSLPETFGQIRRFASFRAYHDAGDYDPAETTIDTRLIGRSVWNTDWILIIPGGTFLANPDQGLQTFINSVSDIKLSLQSYSYSGD